MSKTKVRIALLVASEAWFILAAFSVRNYTGDDAYICFRYARNLASGAGLVFNRGERVEGYTNFLWVLLLAGAAKFTSNPVLVSKSLGALFSALALVACYYLCRNIETEQAPMHGLALVATATSSTFVASGMGGLEGPLFVMLFCWIAVTYLNGVRADGVKQLRWLALSSVLSALLIMARPDGVLTFALLGLHALWTFRRRLAAVAAFSLPAAILYGPYFLWRWHYYGLLFPNTFYAKGGGTWSFYYLGADRIASFLALDSAGLLLGLLIGFYILLAPLVGTTVLGLAVLSRLLFELWSGGDTAGSDRFLVPAIPLIWLLAEHLLMRWVGRDALGVRRRLLVVAVCGLLCLAQIVRFARYRSTMIEPSEAGMERAHIAVGRWLKEHAQPGEAVAVGDIGAIGYLSGLRIIDTDGLTDTTISHASGKFGEKGDAGYVLAYHPEFVVLRVRSCSVQGPDDVIMGLDRKIEQDADFRSGYDQLNCWDFSSDVHLLLFERKRAASFEGPARPAGHRPFRANDRKQFDRARFPLRSLG